MFSTTPYIDMEHVFQKRHLNAWSLQNLLRNNLSYLPPSLLSIIPSQLNTTLTPRSGIGLSTAHYLLSRSHKLVLISRTHSALDALHYQYGSEQVEVLAGDMSDFSLGKKAVDLALSRWGRLDGVVCNHGGLEPVKKVADSTPEEWREAFGGNVFGVVGLVSFDVFLISNFTCLWVLVVHDTYMGVSTLWTWSTKEHGSPWGYQGSQIRRYFTNTPSRSKPPSLPSALHTAA
jgi:hypothetical protein